MKYQRKLISCGTLAATALALAGTAFGQAVPDAPASPRRVGSMAAVGQPAATPKPGAANRMNAGANAQSSLNSKDRDFMLEAAKGNMMEIEMSKMAEKHGQSAEVKKIAKTIMTDHTKADNELMALAAKKGVQLNVKMAKMGKMDGPNFDQDYLAAMVKDHEKDIAAFEKEAKNGIDPDVKSWAGKTLPTLKKHLKMVQDAQGQMKKS